MAASRRGFASPSLSNYTDADHVAPAAITTFEPLREGSAGTFQTLDAMARAVRGEIPPDYSGFRDPFNQQAVNKIIGVRLGGSIISPLFNFIRDEIAYALHPWDMQVVQDCRRTLELRSGDCVSKSVCLATLLAARGIKSRFVAQCPDGEGFNHVYVEFQTFNGAWVALDPTADGRDFRPFGDVGWFQRLPDGGCETTYNIL